MDLFIFEILTDCIKLLCVAETQQPMITLHYTAKQLMRKLWNCEQCIFTANF